MNRSVSTVAQPRRSLLAQAVAALLLTQTLALPVSASQSQAPAIPAVPEAPALPEAPADVADPIVIARNDSEPQTINERRALKANGHISVSNVAGSVQVTGWDREEVSITGTLGEGVERLDISGDSSQLVVAVKLPKNSHTTGETHLTLAVPSGAGVDLSTVSADIAARGLKAAVKANTVSGDVDLQIDAPQVNVQTVSGDLTLRSPSVSTIVNSVSGDLRLNGPRGDLNATTVSGNFELDGGPFKQLKLKTISGDMQLNVSLAADGRVIGESLSGDIGLNLPMATSGVAQVKSFSGEASCKGNSSESKQGNSHEYVWGDGKGAHVELSSFSGDIRVDRAPK